MKYVFLVYGILICLIFGYASFTGWNVYNSVSSGTFKPNGHSAYHK